MSAAAEGVWAAGREWSSCFPPPSEMSPEMARLMFALAYGRVPASERYPLMNRVVYQWTGYAMHKVNKWMAGMHASHPHIYKHTHMDFDESFLTTLAKYMIENAQFRVMADTAGNARVAVDMFVAKTIEILDVAIRKVYFRDHYQTHWRERVAEVVPTIQDQRPDDDVVMHVRTLTPGQRMKRSEYIAKVTGLHSASVPAMDAATNQHRHTIASRTHLFNGGYNCAQ